MVAMRAKEWFLAQAARIAMFAAVGKGTARTKQVQGWHDAGDFLEFGFIATKGGYARDQPAGIGMLRMVKHIIGAGLFNHAARIHDGDAVGHFANCAHVMGNEKDRRAKIALNFVKKVKNLRLHRDIKHRPATGDRGELTHVYAVVNFVNGGQSFVVLDRAEVMKRKAVSKTADFKGGMWSEWEDRAWRKTALRQLANGGDLPYSPEITRAENVDRAIDDGRSFVDVDELGGPVAELEMGRNSVMPCMRARRISW